MTVTCVLVGCMFPGAGYDTDLAAAFGLPGLNLKPGTNVPTGPAFSKARKLLGEQVMRRLFELDAARSDAGLGIERLQKSREVTALDGTMMELARNDVLPAVFGVPADRAAIGGYHDGDEDHVLLAHSASWLPATTRIPTSSSRWRSS